MASGFPSGGIGGSYFFSGSSRSINPTTSQTTTQNSYRTQLSQIFLDSSSSQIAHHQHNQHQRLHHSPAGSYIGKRTLSDYQSSHPYQQQQNQSSLNPALNALLARSVKPRIYQNATTTSPISTLSPMEFSANNFSPELSQSSQHQHQQQRYGFPLLQQLRPQQMNNNSLQIQTLQGVPFQPSPMSQHNRGIVSTAAPPAVVGVQESEKKMMNRLQELEKQLLDDDDNGNEEGCGSDVVSVITNTNNEWSETIQNLANVVACEGRDRVERCEVFGKWRARMGK